MTARQQIIYWAIALAVLLALLWLLRGIMLPFVAGMAVAYFLDPVADYLERRGLSRALATLIVLIWNFCANRLWTFRPTVYEQSL